MSSVPWDTPPGIRHPEPAYVTRLRRRRNLAAAAAALLLAGLVLTGVLDAATTRYEDRTLSVGTSPRLVIRDGVGGGLRGGIAVRAGAPGIVHVEGKVHATWRVRYVLEQRGDEVWLEAEPRLLLAWLSAFGPARFTVTAPAETHLDVVSRSAPIEVLGIVGGGSLQTTNGGIRLDGAGGRLDAATRNGPITVTGFDGAARLHTTNGAVEVEASRGSFDVATTNGSVTLDADLAAAARHRVETTNGNVRVRMRGTPSLRVDARTSNGAVTAGRPIAVSEQTPSALVATVGSGDGELWVRTTNGAIALE